MTGPFFVDTNVLVYARDAGEAQKQARARDWLTFLWQTHQGRLSTQVLQEYYQVVTRRLRPGLAADTARGDVRDLAVWQPVAADLPLLERAWVAESRFQLSWWDALIVGAAQQLGCRYLLSEDLQDGQDLDGVIVANPFKREVPAP
ncbi:MAG TPA: PIN domain-containing protein [Denitromonas sp.]|nr:PIN domain-containing protein [Chromatiaceae bacterium]HPR05791.1 PIN domain-containing protein [Denitromonas sp.]